MTFFAFGLNHETAPVALREAFALAPDTVRTLYRTLPLSNGAELVLLSTCNRTEAILFGREADVAAVRAALSLHAGRIWPAEATFYHEDEAAVRHLIRVTAGLDSMVLGDAQILSQVREAYRLADESDAVGAALHRLMHTAFRAAKRIRTETALYDGAASVSGLALRMARDHYHGTARPLTARPVLVLGAGEMATAALRGLQSLGATDVRLANRTPERATSVAEPFGAHVVAWEDRYAEAAAADLVIVASGASEPVLRADALPEQDVETLVVDLAVPRNVEPAVALRRGYRLVDLDQLEAATAVLAERRRASVPAAEAICEEGLREFVAWAVHHDALQPALHALRDTFEAIRRDTLDRYASRFAEADRADLDAVTQSILQKLLAVPIVRLKAHDAESLDFARGVRFLAHIFGRPDCDDASARPGAPAAPPAAHPADGLADGCPFLAAPSTRDAG